MRTFRIILETLFWMVAVVVLMGGVAMVLGFITAPMIGGLAAVFILVLLPLVLGVVRAIRRRRAGVVLGYLDQAVRLNLPLPRMLRAAERSERGVLQYRLLHLRDRLESGDSVGVSVQYAVPELDLNEAATLSAAERLGQLPRALQSVVVARRRVARDDAATSGFVIIYPFFMTVIVTMVLSTILVFVIPKYEQIFKDFGTQLPWITRAVLDTCRFGVPQVALPLAAFALLWWAGRTLGRTFYVEDRASDSVSTIRHVRDRVAWIIPVLHGIERDRGLGEAFELIARAMSGGMPADRALAEASHLGVNYVLRRRLAAWATRVTDGISLHEAAAVAGMPGLVSEMLAPVRDTGGAADVMDFLGRYYASRFNRAAILLREAMIPLLSIVFGFIVAVVALALFLPMISLIQTLSAPGHGHWRL